MGMFDTVHFINSIGKDIQLQFKSGENLLKEYEIGDEIPVSDGIHFDWEGCFVIYKGKLVAAFDKDENPLQTKWGIAIDYPDLDKK